ncbi:MAG: hypothetical protein EBR82_00095 [Caulobacteraceae bacterium]|nr:hypothetical protein [Caulobacteraceae bacterium]
MKMNKMKVYAIDEGKKPSRILVMVESSATEKPRCVAAVHTSEAYLAIKRLMESENSSIVQHTVYT